MNVFKGILKHWNDKRGFGFIAVGSEKKDVFIHISALTHMSRKPVVGDIISFQIQTDHIGQRQATNANIEGVRVINQKLINIGNKLNSFVAAALTLIFLILLCHSIYIDLPKISLNNIWQTLNISKDQTLDSSTDSILHSLYQNKQSNIQVKGEGFVIKLLSDDIKGTRHQRFVLRLGNGQTILVAHNIDLSSRINTLKKGHAVAFYGEYEWNSQGGIIHWTHRDPRNIHAHGWLEHSGKKYQ